MKKYYRMGLIVAIALFTSSFVFADDAAETLYKAKCAMCHGADGSGNTPAGKKVNARDFHSPEVAKQTDAQLLETTQKGKNKMPAYDGKLKLDEMKSLVAYIRELAKKK